MPKWDFTKVKDKDQQEQLKWDFTKVKDKDQQEQLWIDESAPVSVQSTGTSGPKWDFTKTKSEPTPVKTADTTKQPQERTGIIQRVKDWVQRQKDENEAHREMVRLWNEKKAFAAMKGEDPSKVAPPPIPEYLREKMSKQTQHYWDEALKKW